ncbi:MAG: ATP-binding protein, partial [Methylococcales bacterium]
AVHLAVELIRLEIAGERLGGRSPRDWLRHLKSLGRTRHLKIELQPQREAARNATEKFVSDAPSVRNVPEWFIWAVTPEPVIFSRTIGLSDGAEWRLLIQADPDDEIVEAWNEALDFFALIGVMAGIVLVLVTISVERAFKPVSVILDGLDRLENGEYHQPLPEFPLPEFNRIANAINQAARALESARQDNHSLRQHSLEVREQERQFLARDLHDEFGQSLSAIKVVAVFLKNQALDRTSLAAVESIAETCDHLFSVLRNMLRRLHPLILDELGLKASLEELLEIWSAQQPSVTLSFRCDPEIDAFSTKLQIHIFRIVQECMTNILKHARATQVSVQIEVIQGTNDPRLRIEIRDDGIGFDPNAVKTSFGLRGIRERVEGLGGIASLRAAPGDGVRIDIGIPFVRPAA